MRVLQCSSCRADLGLLQVLTGLHFCLTADGTVLKV